MKQILTKPRIAGLRQHKTEDRHGEAVWDPIIDRPTWDQLRSILLQPSHRTPRPSQGYPLRGVLKCGECGKFLSAVYAKGVRNYGCRVDQHGCGKVSINAVRVEGIGVLSALAVG